MFRTVVYIINSVELNISMSVLTRLQPRPSCGSLSCCLGNRHVLVNLGLFKHIFPAKKHGEKFTVLYVSRAYLAHFRLGYCVLLM